MVLRRLPFLATGLSALVLGHAAFAAPPTLRHQADAQGDVVVFGNTLAVDCSSEVPAPPGSTTTSCAAQSNTSDTAPDLFWRDNLANTTITAAQARSSSTLVLPPGAKVSYARIYWSALKVGNQADKQITLDWAGGPTESVSADDSWVVDYGFSSHPDWFYYQSTADVTNYVAKWGAGDFRVTGVDALPLVGMDVDRAFSAWTIVVFYENPGDELRNLALFDGFTSVDPGFPGQEKAEVTLNGFLVPPGFSAKMTAFTYEGDKVYTGDFFTFNGQKLSDAENPQDNFFNSSRSYLGSAVSGSSDVPKLSGKAGTMAGYDLDTANVTSLVKAGDSSAKVGAESSLDIFLLGGFVTSLTNKAPDFPDFEKVATDLDGGALKPGDVVEYVLKAKNTGNDTAIATVLTDTLDPGLDLVPGSIEIVSGGPVGPKTDAKDTDQAEYNAATRTITVRLGLGAGASQGGSVKVGETVEVKFSVKVVAQSGSIPNQGQINAKGNSGGPQKSWLSDADPLTPGAQPTLITIQECEQPSDCPAEKPWCDTQTKTCQPCSTDAECTDPNFPACQPDGTCGECSESNQTKCTTDKPACNTFTGNCEMCTPGPNGNAEKCKNDPNGPVCRVDDQDNSTFCGCDKDSDCGDQKSGKVCDIGQTERCMNGCRGVDGNGCPDGFECTSQDSSIGQCVPTEPGTGGAGGAGGNNGGGDDSGDDGGCGCRMPGRSLGNTGSALGLLLGLGLLVLRRRTGAGGPSSR